MDFTHFDPQGNAIMVDVSQKSPSFRSATAKGTIILGETIAETIREHTNQKGDVLSVAQIAGIMAVKNTANLIPLCHPLPISHCSVTFSQENDRIHAFCTVKTQGNTGVEMEALTGVQIALLTIYDMCKAGGKGMTMEHIHLLEKTGGKSGDYSHKESL